MECFLFLGKITIKLIRIFHLLESSVIFEVYAESLINILRWVQILEEHIIGWTDTQNLEFSLISSLLDQNTVKCILFGFNILFDFLLFYITYLNNLKNGQAIWLELCWDNHFEVRLLFLLIVEMSLFENVGRNIVEGKFS